MHAEQDPGTAPTKTSGKIDSLSLQFPKRRPSSASTASEDGTPCVKKRDRRRRDAPGGTRNIQKIYRWEASQRVTKFRALLPLTKNMEPYILGDFREMQAALQAADRAVLAFYGRGHPLGATNLPHELYEMEQLEGAELADLLLALEPEDWDRSKAVAGRPSTRKAALAGGSTSADELLPGSADNPRTSEDSRGEEADEAGDEGEGHRGRPRRPRGGAQPCFTAKHRARRLKQLQAKQELRASLGSSTEEPAVKGGSDRPINVFEADRPRTAGPDTRVTQNHTELSWADPRSSRFARAYDYAADLRLIARCRAAGTAVEVKMHDDMGCSRCGAAGHTARSLACPIRAFTGEPSTAPDQSQEGPLPAWHDKLTPEMENVLRAVRKVAGDCLDAPEMSLFQPLLGSLSPDALLAVGCLLEAQLLARAKQGLNPCAKE